VARRLLEINADMAHVLKQIARTVLPAAIGALILSGISEAQQLDVSSLTAAANPAASSTPALKPGAQQELNLSASACGPAGLHEQTKITFVDEHHNAWYRATMKGLNLSGEQGLRVIGGLLPRWNLAAQMGASGGTAPGNTVNSMAWATPNMQLGANPYSTPRVRLVWVPTLTGPCPMP
jgi:hypothetical protein